MKRKSLLLTAVATLGLTATILAQTVPSYVPTNGLAAWYSFTGNANDDSGGNNHGTVNGATLTTGKLGNPNTAYLFNGISNTIDFSMPFLNGGQVSSFTFHVLVKFKSLLNSPNIWGKTFNWGEVNFSVSNNGEIAFIFANNVTGNKYSAIYSDFNVAETNQWYDIVITYENSIGKIYLNGLPITTLLQWTVQGGSILSTSQIEAQCNYAQFANSSKIGLRYTGAVPGNYLDGVIDEFGIWNRALTQQEITDLYNSSSAETNELLQENKIRIYPNPANTHLTIDYGNFASLNGYQLVIENALGQQMFQTAINQQSDYISLASWTGNGLYFAHIIDAQGNTIDIRKIVLQ